MSHRTIPPAYPEDLVAEGMREPLALSEAELAAVQVFDPTVTQLYPFAPVRNPNPAYFNTKTEQYSTRFAGGEDAGVAFRRVQTRVVQAGLDILITPALCEASARAVCKPFKVNFTDFPKVIDAQGKLATFNAPGGSNYTTARIHAGACVASPALGLQSFLVHRFVTEMRDVFLNIAEDWKIGKCPYLARASQLVKKDLAEALRFETMANMAIYSPIIAADFQSKVKGVDEDLLVTDSSIMRWIVNRFKENNTFTRTRTSKQGGRDCTIECPATVTIRAMLSGSTNEGIAFGGGVSGLSAWLYTQRNEDWFKKESAEAKKYFKDIERKASFYYPFERYNSDCKKLIAEQFNYGHCRRVRGEARMAP